MAILEVILAGVALGGILWLQPPKWPWRILAVLVAADLVILSSKWPPVIRSPYGFPAPEDLGMLDQADVTRAGIQLAGAILIGGLVYMALSRPFRHADWRPWGTRGPLQMRRWNASQKAWEYRLATPDEEEAYFQEKVDMAW